jgi:hypothetical protein
MEYFRMLKAKRKRLREEEQEPMDAVSHPSSPQVPHPTKRAQAMSVY